MTFEQVTQVVEMIAEKLGVAVEKVYPMLVGQAKVFCGTYHVTLGVGVVALVMLIIGIVAFCIGEDTYSDVPTVFGIIFMLIGGMVFLGVAIYSLCDLNNYMTALHNPDWWAIEYVTKLLT